MALLRPDMESCEKKCRCGVNSANPGVVYNCDNPCGGGVPFDAETCECGIGEAFHQIAIEWQVRLDVRRGGDGYTQYSVPMWYNGYQNWRSQLGSGGYENRAYLQYIYLNKFACIADGDWYDYPKRGVFDVYFYLRREDEEGETYLTGEGGCYWPESCDSCWYASSSVKPPYQTITRTVFAQVTASRWITYLNEEGRLTRRLDRYVLYYDMIEGERGYRPMLEFTDPALDEEDPSRQRVIDLRGQFNIGRGEEGICNCTITDDMEGRRN